ncbi:MAG: hypothetical protein ACRC62_10020 [Microcoleus sp.]
MYELELALQAATTLDRISAAASRFESAIYTADDWFQAYIVPASKRYAIAALLAFVRGAYFTYIAGQETGEWFQGWFGQYILGGLPELVESPPLMLCGAACAGYLMPAKEVKQVVKPVRKHRKGKIK